MDASKTVFLVTGGAGFIGSNLCETLLQEGYTVRCLDNFSTGKRENIQTFLKVPRFQLLKEDIRNYDACMHACQDVDYVLHQAAWGSVPRSIEFPLMYEEINIKGTLNMLEAAKCSGVKRFVYASSSSVYGDSLVLPKKEGQEGKLLSPYALTKRTNEEYANLYTKLYQLETVGLRYFNVFGRRQDPHGQYAAVIPKFIKHFIEETSPIIHGDGMQSRDFTYIENVIQANVKACHAPPEAAGQAYNIAYGGQETILDVCREIRSLLQKTHIVPSFGPDRAGDIKHSNADISLAKEMLGYSPTHSFIDGIREAIAWYKENV